jgi:hypothetical protein
MTSTRSVGRWSELYQATICGWDTPPMVSAAARNLEANSGWDEGMLLGASPPPAVPASNRCALARIWSSRLEPVIPSAFRNASCCTCCWAICCSRSAPLGPPSPPSMGGTYVPPPSARASRWCIALARGGPQSVSGAGSVGSELVRRLVAEDKSESDPYAD